MKPRITVESIRNQRLSGAPAPMLRERKLHESRYEGYHVAAHPYIGKTMHFHDGTDWTPSELKAKKFATRPEAEAFLANLPSTTTPSRGRPHLWNAHKDLAPDHSPAVHNIPGDHSDSDAYDYTQTQGVKHGDVLVHKGRVGFMLRAWPVSVVGKHDAWHTLETPDAGEEPSVDDADIKQSVAAAKAHAAKIGIKESGWGDKGAKDDSHEEYGSDVAREAAGQAKPAGPADSAAITMTRFAVGRVLNHVEGLAHDPETPHKGLAIEHAVRAAACVSYRDASLTDAHLEKCSDALSSFHDAFQAHRAHLKKG